MECCTICCHTSSLKSLDFTNFKMEESLSGYHSIFRTRTHGFYRFLLGWGSGSDTRSKSARNMEHLPLIPHRTFISNYHGTSRATLNIIFSADPTTVRHEMYFLCNKLSIPTE